MDSYIHPTQEEQRIMDGISVPVGARQRVHAKFMAMARAKSKRVIGASAFVFSGAIAAVVLVVGMSPQPQGTMGNLSFLEVAYAAYEHMPAMVDDGYPVHHIVTETKISGTDNGPVTDKTESWQLSDGSRSFTVNQSSTSADRMFFARSGESSYVSRELAAQISTQLSGLEKGSTMHFYSGDLHLEVSGTNPGYALSFPNDLYGIGSELDPLDSTMRCFDLEEKSSEQRERESLMNQLKRAAGYDTDNSMFDPQQVTALLLEGENAGQVEDMGTYPDDSGRLQRWYRVVVHIDSKFSREVQTTTFGFDPESHRLRTVVSVTDDGFGFVVADTTRVTTDEFVAIGDAHPGLMNPEGQGLVRATYPVSGLPAYAVENGCYRLNADHPERLSAEEENIVRDRIKGSETE